jgi:hypothetical protein
MQVKRSWTNWPKLIDLHNGRWFETKGFHNEYQEGLRSWWVPLIDKIFCNPLPESTLLREAFRLDKLWLLHQTEISYLRRVWTRKRRILDAPLTREKFRHNLWRFLNRWWILLFSVLAIVRACWRYFDALQRMTCLELSLLGGLSEDNSSWRSSIIMIAFQPISQTICVFNESCLIRSKLCSL